MRMCVSQATQGQRTLEQPLRAEAAEATQIEVSVVEEAVAVDETKQPLRAEAAEAIQVEVSVVEEAEQVVQGEGAAGSKTVDSAVLSTKRDGWQGHDLHRACARQSSRICLVWPTAISPALMPALTYL